MKKGLQHLATVALLGLMLLMPLACSEPDKGLTNPGDIVTIEITHRQSGKVVTVKRVEVSVVDNDGAGSNSIIPLSQTGTQNGRRIFKSGQWGGFAAPPEILAIVWLDCSTDKNGSQVYPGCRVTEKLDARVDGYLNGNHVNGVEIRPGDLDQFDAARVEVKKTGRVRLL